MILAIDIGTTAVKCALFAGGGAHAGAAAPGTCIAIERAPVAAEGVRQETDARLWSDAVQTAIARLPRGSSQSPPAC